MWRASDSYRLGSRWGRQANAGLRTPKNGAPVRHRQPSTVSFPVSVAPRWRGGTLRRALFAAVLAMAVAGVLSASAAAATCTDNFIGKNEEQWDNAAHWSKGKPTHADVACWPAGITVLATEPENFGGGEVGSMQGGSLKVGKRNGFYIFGPGESTLSGSLTLEEQADLRQIGSEKLIFHVNGTVTDAPAKLEGENGGGIELTQGPGSTLTIGGTSQVEVHPGSSISTESPITIDNPEFNTSSPITTTSTITFGPGISIDQEGGDHATFTAAGVTPNSEPKYGFGGDTLVLTGGETTVAAGTKLESGAIELKGGVLHDEGAIGDSTSIFDETTLAPTTLTGGALAGTGTVEGPLNVTAGNVAPGPHGKLTVAGNYTQEAGGTLAIGIAGPTPGSGFDQLLVGGSATLAGALSVTNENGYEPPLGQAFKIISGASSRTGTFATVGGPSAGIYGLGYEPDGATLTTTVAPSPKGGSTSSTTPTTTTTVTNGSPEIIPAGVASTPKAIEELQLGCSGSKLVLNDVYIQGGHVAISGSAAKSLVGKKVKILFNEGKQVATTTVTANGQYATTAPLPPAKIRESNSTRYTAEVGKLRSVHLKLVRRLLLEPLKASGTTVTLTGQVTLPLTKPIAPVVIEQQLECGKTTIAKTFIPSANGRFHITLTVPANAKAAIYRLKSKVAANAHATKHGFTTFSLPLPVVLG